MHKLVGVGTYDDPRLWEKLLFPQTRVVVGADPYEFVQKRTNPSLPLRVAKRREGLKKQHSVLFFPERDRAHANPQSSRRSLRATPTAGETRGRTHAKFRSKHGFALKTLS